VKDELQMTEILTPPVLLLDTFMCSQSGNLHDLSACSDHSNSCILENDPEPDTSSSLARQGLAHPPLHPEMGMRYLSIPPTDDVRFNSDPDHSHHSPVYSVEPAITTSTFLPYTNIYQPATYSSGGSSYFSPASSLFSVPDIKPRLGAINASPGMASSRSAALPNPASPISARGLYNTAGTPLLQRRSDLLSRSPSSTTVRGLPLSPSSSGFTSPTNMENSLGGQASPPLHPTEVIYQLQTPEGQVIRPEIFGKIDKGFFMADNDWTCYRRNYFSLNCSYTLHPAIPTGSVHLVLRNGQQPQIHDFAMSIAAVVDGRDGKAIELVQHTPKRDKGPQDKPSRVTLQPRPPPSLGMYGGDGGLGGGSRGLYDQGYGANANQQVTEATFERIQFKNATANNGKRRAAQQYYHLLVELFADVGGQHPDRWVRIATRMSAPMVVRGRSPGHYQGDRRGSNSSTGPGSGGAGGGGAFSPGGSTSRTPGEMSMGGSSMPPSSSYGGSYDTRSHHYRSNTAPLQIPMEPTLSAEEAKSIEEAPGYLYYAAPIWEGHESRYLPGVSEYSKVKQEYSSGYTLPSLMNSQDGFGRHCGRWDGAPESKGYFPSVQLQQELNMT